MMLSFLGAYGLHRALLGSEHWLLRLCWLAVALSTLAGLIAVGISRTGQLSVLAAYFLVILTHLPWRQRLWGLLLCLLFASVLVVSSDRMQARFALAFKETSSFEQDGERTSVGARLKAWQFSAELIQQAPWLGHGIGSYRPLAHVHFTQSPICNLGVCEQPHNQFLLTAVETGVLGVLALAAFLMAPLINRAQPGAPAAHLTPPFIAVLVVTACFDSSLMIQAQSFFTVITVALLTASRSTPAGDTSQFDEASSKRNFSQTEVVSEGPDRQHWT
jgi:O-antigen ligase